MPPDRAETPAAVPDLEISPRATLFVLLLTTAILLLGAGLFNTLLGVRATIEQFDPSMIGLIMSAYFGGFILGTFVCVGIIGRVGHVRAFSAFAAIFTAMALAHVVWVSPLPWLLFRFVAGFAMVGMALVIESWLNAQASAEHRGRIFSTYMVVNLSAVAFGQLLLTTADPATFVLFAGAAMLFALSLVPTALVRVRAPAPQEAAGLGLRELLRISPVGVVGCFVIGVSGGSFWGMAPVFMTALGYEEGRVALFMFVAIIGGMLSQFPIGRFSDGRDRRKVILGVTTLAAVAAVAVTLATFAPFAALAAAAFFLGAFKFPIYGLCVARTHDVLRPDQALAATRGLMLVFGAGSVIGPFAGGVAMSVVGTMALFGWIALVLAILAAFTATRLRRNAPVPPEEQSHFVPHYTATQEALELAEAEAYNPAQRAAVEEEQAAREAEQGEADLPR